MSNIVLFTSFARLQKLPITISVKFMHFWWPILFYCFATRLTIKFRCLFNYGPGHYSDHEIKMIETSYYRGYAIYHVGSVINNYKGSS